MLAFGIDDIWSCDLVEMQAFAAANNGYRYMLNVIDVLSKYAWSVPLKDKTALSTLNAFKEIVNKSNRKPSKIWCDKGKEFYNKFMDEWLKENSITRYSTYSEHKFCIIERYNRTLKTKMFKRFSALNTRKWLDILPTLLTQYNATKHSTTKMTPVEASQKKNEALLLLRQEQRQELPSAAAASKFKVGDKVRISRIKGIFEQGYLPNWSEELFEVIKVKNTTPPTYILKDWNNQEIGGSFYNEELQRATQEIFRIEKILRKKKVKGVEYGLVKWLGHNDKFNSWEPMSEIIKIN